MGFFAGFLNHQQQNRGFNEVKCNWTSWRSIWWNFQPSNKKSIPINPWFLLWCAYLRREFISIYGNLLSKLTCPNHYVQFLKTDFGLTNRQVCTGYNLLQNKGLNQNCQFLLDLLWCVWCFCACQWHLFREGCHPYCEQPQQPMIAAKLYGKWQKFIVSYII